MGGHMPEISINWIALLVAVIAKQVIGALWHSPMVFGKVWSAETGVSDSEMRATLPRALPIEIVGSLIAAFVLLHAVRYAQANSVLLGAAVGFLNWLGFVATSRLGSVLFAKGSFRLYLIDAGYWLVGLVVMGAILGGWQ